uniref:Uncharacterized protein n=1 Tax=Octopus bimaculoides TaxID=37653 RepID=A0A0L8IGE3_OCTBM
MSFTYLFICFSFNPIKSLCFSLISPPCVLPPLLAFSLTSIVFPPSKSSLSPPANSFSISSVALTND